MGTTQPPQTPQHSSTAAPQSRFHIKKQYIGIGLVALVALIGLATWLLWPHPKTTKNSQNANSSHSTANYDTNASAGLTSGKCEGSGSTSIVPPMKLEQVGFVLPYGLMVGGHVTPIDHQYYNGLDVKALRDTYDVVAPADGRIVDIQHRGNQTNTPAHTVDIPSSDEYRIVFAHTCSFLTYVDLVTSLDDTIKSQLPAGWTPQNSHDINIPVKQGEVVGHIGGQTLDFAVWDLSQPPLGFINRTAYDNAEPWKVFTAPPSKYFAASIKDKVLAKYIRTVEPIDGKIDYDQDGKLIGTWFREGSNGYAGPGTHSGMPGYWFGHLSFAPDYLDPSVMVVSTGNYTDDKAINPNDTSPTSAAANDAHQFWLKPGSTDPTTISVSSGLIKYELLQSGTYTKLDGTRWDAMSWAQVKASPNAQVTGVLLVQMLDTHKLKVEFFPGKTAAQVSTFDANAKLYNRGDDAKAVSSNNGRTETAH